MQQQALIEVPFGIVKPQSFYTVQGVRLPSGAYGDVQVTEKLLDNGKSRTQKEWVSYRNETGWGPGSAPLITTVLARLYDNRSADGVAELRNIFGDDFRNSWMMTATGIVYLARAHDVVTHDAGTPEERTLEARLAGPNGYINDRMSEETQALLGSGDINRLSNVYKWVTGKKIYLLRLGKQPKQGEERALVLGGISFVNDFNVYADVGIDDGGPARGVRVAPQNSTGSKG